jgi:molecular chaperone GrpE
VKDFMAKVVGKTNADRLVKDAQANAAPASAASGEEGGMGHPNQAAAQNGPQREAPQDLAAELVRTQQEAADLRDKYLRAAAAVQNTRKWTEREVLSRTTEEQREFLRQLLEVMDSLDKILEVPQDQEALRTGVKLARRQLERVLEKAGVRRMEVQAGQVFDPHSHEAVEARSGNGTQAQVYDVVQAGYMQDDKLLRPARVIVQQ